MGMLWVQEKLIFFFPERGGRCQREIGDIQSMGQNPRTYIKAKNQGQLENTREEYLSILGNSEVCKNGNRENTLWKPSIFLTKSEVRFWGRDELRNEVKRNTKLSIEIRRDRHKIQLGKKMFVYMYIKDAMCVCLNDWYVFIVKSHHPEINIVRWYYSGRI